MAITITNNTIQDHFFNINNTPVRKYSDNLHTRKEDKIENKNSRNNELINKATSRDLINFLSTDEKKVLSEVFNFELPEKNPLQNFNHSNNLLIFKGSIIDVKL